VAGFQQKKKKKKKKNPKNKEVSTLAEIGIADDLQLFSGFGSGISGHQGRKGKNNDGVVPSELEV